MSQPPERNDVNVPFEGTQVPVDNMRNSKANTVRKTTSDLRFFHSWLAYRNELRSIHEITPMDLDLLIADFFLSVRRTNGDEYEPDTLKSFQSSFARKLSEAGYEQDILTSPAFKHSRDVLAAKRKELKGKGLGNRKKRVDPFTNDELNILWDQELLGAGNPGALINTMWLNITTHFVTRGRQDHIGLMWGDIELHQTSSGDEFLSFTERTTKTKNGIKPDVRNSPKMFALPGNPRCPVAMYKEFGRRRPPSTNVPDARFYLQVDRAKNLKAPGIWFKDQPLGKNSIGDIAKSMSKSANLVGKKTYHSGRRTALMKPVHAKIAPQYITQEKTGVLPKSKGLPRKEALVQNLRSCGSEYDSSCSDSVTSKDSRTNIRVNDDEADQESLDMNSQNIAPLSYLAAANNSMSTTMSFERAPNHLPASSVEGAPPRHVSSIYCTPRIKSECVSVEEDSYKEFRETENERVEQFNRESASNDQTSPESETSTYRIHNSAQGLFIDTDLILPDLDWAVKHETNGDIRLVKLSETVDSLLCKVVVTVSKAEPYLNIIVHQKEKLHPTHDIYSKYGGKPLSNKEIGKMVEEINSYGICIGNPDPEFKTSCPKSGLACIEIDFGEECDQSTIISAKCHLLFNAGPRCPNCCSLRTSLRATASRKRRRTDNLEDPLIHMSREQLQNHLKTISSENKCLKKRICQLSNALASIKKIVLSNADWEGITNIKEANMSGIHETAVIGSLALDNIKQEHFETDINNISQEEGFLNPTEEDSGEFCSLLNNTEHVVKEESRDDMSVENTNMFVASELDLVCSDDAD